MEEESNMNSYKGPECDGKGHHPIEPSAICPMCRGKSRLQNSYQKRQSKKVYLVASEGPCGTNFYGAFASKKKAEARRDEKNANLSMCDYTYVMELEVE